MNTQPRKGKRLVAVLLTAALSFCGVANAIAAQTKVVTRSMVVRYDDLNMSSNAGVEALYGRIAAAARSVCKAPGYVAFVEIRQRTKECRTQAIDTAVRSVNNRTLTAMHKQKTQRRFG